MVREKIPYKLVRRNMKKYVNNEVSKESILYIQDYVTNMLDSICYNLDLEFKERNINRTTIKLPKAKRIDVSIVKKVVHKLFMYPLKFNTGDTGQGNIDTVFSEAGVEIA